MTKLSESDSLISFSMGPTSTFSLIIPFLILSTHHLIIVISTTKSLWTWVFLIGQHSNCIIEIVELPYGKSLLSILLESFHLTTLEPHNFIFVSPLSYNGYVVIDLSIVLKERTRYLNFSTFSITLFTKENVLTKSSCLANWLIQIGIK